MGASMRDKPHHVLLIDTQSFGQIVVLAPSQMSPISAHDAAVCAVRSATSQRDGDLGLVVSAIESAGLIYPDVETISLSVDP